MVQRGVTRIPRPEGPLRDPLERFSFREVTGPQVLQALEQHVNPFTSKRWSGRYRGRKLLDVRKKLPVFEYMDSFYEAFNSHQVVIVHGDTGTGKTTQIPQLVAYADLPHKKGKIIACAQTRRIAATAASKRVADEMDVTLGEQVGYSVRFDSKRDPTSTFLLFMTDGMLLHEAMHDPDLSKYSTIILDEVHERTLATDVLMGTLKKVLERRPDLKLVIMSATMDARQLSEYYGANEPFLLEIPGRAYNVDVEYSLEQVVSYPEATVAKVLQIHKEEPEGDILVFLTGEEEIEKARSVLQAEADILAEQEPDVYGPLCCLSLYSNLPHHLQQLVWERPTYNHPPRPNGPAGRKVVIATNIAETSLTIDGIVYVVDPGFAKPRIYDPDSESGLETHTVRIISKASAKQRKGRAGRTRDGKCYRLYTREEYDEMAEREIPEVQTISLGELVLMLATIGYRDPTTFPYIDKPDPRTLKRAQALLRHLGAVDKYNRPTPLGRQMVQFPLEPQLSKMVIKSPEFGCSQEIVTIAAMLSAPHVWVRPYDKQDTADNIKREFFADRQSDHLTLAKAYDTYTVETGDMNEVEREEWCKTKYLSVRALREAQNIRNQLVRIMERLRIPLVSSYAPPQTTTGEHTTSLIGPALSPDDEGNRERLRENVRKALVAGFFLQVAHSEGLSDMAHSSAGNSTQNRLGTLNLEGGNGRRGRRGRGGQRAKIAFETIRDGATAFLHPSTVLPKTEESEWVIFHSFVFTTKPYMRTVTNIKEDWLWQYSSEYYNPNENKDNETRKAFLAINRQIVRGQARAERRKAQAAKGKGKQPARQATTSAQGNQQREQEQGNKGKRVRTKRVKKAKGGVAQALAEGSRSA